MKKGLIAFLTICFIFISGCRNQNDIQNITDADTMDNSYFYKNDVLQMNYKGIFIFDDIIEKEVKLNINKVVNLKNGKLYELKLDSIEGVPNERLSLGFFYVKNDKIYKIEISEENVDILKTSGEIPNGSVIVCQDNEIKDTLGKDESGWHYYLEVDGDRREYCLYNNQVSSGYYESFTWEKSKGLISYRSGYGAERDSIELQQSND